MKNFFRQNGILLLVIALLLSILIGVSSALLGGNSDPLSNVVNTVTAPIRGGISAVLDWAEGVYEYVFHYEELHQELDDLRVQVAELEEQVRQGQEASRENEQLRDLLDLQEKRRDFVFESARVTSRSTDNWASTLTLSKGSSSRPATAWSLRRVCWWGWCLMWASTGVPYPLSSTPASRWGALLPAPTPPACWREILS